jgi:hypothetical protein
VFSVLDLCSPGKLFLIPLVALLLLLLLLLELLLALPVLRLEVTVAEAWTLLLKPKPMHHP